MSTFIGVKLVKLMAMNLAAYNIHQGWELGPNENGEDAGYLVEYLDGGKPNHPDHEGYISWSPKDVADRAYRPTDGMSFGLAIEALKMGKKVARKGFNGKGMWLELQVPDDNSKMTQPYAYFNIPDCQEGMRRIPYVCTTIDMISDDWCIVD